MESVGNMDNELINLILENFKALRIDVQKISEQLNKIEKRIDEVEDLEKNCIIRQPSISYIIDILSRNVSDIIGIVDDFKIKKENTKNVKYEIAKNLTSKIITIIISLIGAGLIYLILQKVKV